MDLTTFCPNLVGLGHRYSRLQNLPSLSIESTVHNTEILMEIRLLQEKIILTIKTSIKYVIIFMDTKYNNHTTTLNMYQKEYNTHPSYYLLHKPFPQTYKNFNISNNYQAPTLTYTTPTTFYMQIPLPLTHTQIPIQMSSVVTYMKS